MEPPVIFFIALIFLLFIGLAVYSHKKEKERCLALAAWAGKKGYHFHAEKVRHFDDNFPSFDFLRTGSNRYAHNIISGSEGDHRITICDGHYETHSTDSKGNRQTHHHHFSCVFVQTGFPLSPMQIRREGFLDRIKSTFGFGDINFESSEFSRMFHVSGQDKRWVYDVIHNRMMEFLMESRKPAIQTDDVFLSIRKNERLDPTDLDQFVGFAFAFINLIPEHVKNLPA